MEKLSASIEKTEQTHEVAVQVFPCPKPAQSNPKVPPSEMRFHIDSVLRYSAETSNKGYHFECMQVYGDNICLLKQTKTD